MAGMFGSVSDGSYKGMYPGADPYAKAEMIKQGIPSANQEALQKPTIDPINVATLGGASAIANPAMVMNPGGLSADVGQYAINGLFGYLMNQMVTKVRNTSIDNYK
jgi:hypothetical protein